MAVAKKQTPRLALVTNPAPPVKLSPKMVTMAKRGAELKAIMSAAKRELAGIDTTFETFFQLNNCREATDAKGNVLVVLGHGEPNRLNQEALKAAHPEIVKKFTWAHPWDSPSYKAPVVK